MTYSIPSLGFEATYRFSSQLANIQDIIDDEDDDILRSIIESNRFQKKCDNANLTLFDLSDAHIDDSNVEIKTHVVLAKERKRLLNQFTKLNKLVSSYQLVPSIISHNNNLEGGGHIHLGYTEHADQYAMSNGKKMVFVGNMLLNLNNIINTYPSLLWAMNSPYDNINANSSLLNPKFKKGIDYLKLSYNDTGLGDMMRVSCTGVSSKNYAIIFRFVYSTFEFRFFTMPKDADGLKLNIDVAESLYKIAFEHSTSKKIISPRYTEKKQLMNMTVNEAVRNLKDCAKYLGIDYNEFVKHDRVKALRKRFQLERIHNPNKLLRETYLN
jgi:hypothetical protein